MSNNRLFRRSRLRLCLWYAGVMGVILAISGLGAYRALIRANWVAMEREIESIAGTLHDSVEPLLPPSADPTTVLRQLFPELCLNQHPCNRMPTVIQRHTMGISDRDTYYIRLFNHRGQLLAFSPNQPANLSPTFNPEPWQTISTTQGIRYRQFTIMLHSADANPNPETQRSSWGYLQIGRTLAPLDAEKVRIQRILVSWLPLVLGLVIASSWWLSGLAMQPIYDSYRQQQQFTADAAHELRTPLASLLATVEAILRVPLSNPQDTHTMLRQIERQGRRLSHLITDLLQLTSLEQQSSSVQFQPCCLNDLISDLSEEFLELATDSDIQLTSDSPKPLVYVLGNEPQLYRLVSNLIDNAIRYTPAGNSINVSLEKSDHTAVIKVTDTGIGIAPTEQAHIFDRFYRVNRDRSRHTGGSGLGLAIAKAIAQSHHGSLQVQSELGVGSIFTLRLPLVGSSVTSPQPT